MPSRVITATLAALLVATILVLPSTAQTSSVGALTVPVTGKSTTGVPFTGVLKIEKFTLNTTTNTVNAIGSITGTAGGTAIGVTRVRVPIASLTTTSTTQSSCPILNLTVGPIHLDLLGLVINTNQINLQIVAQPGPGNLLGNLLCDIANLLNTNGSLTQLVTDLNNLLALL